MGGWVDGWLLGWDGVKSTKVGLVNGRSKGVRSTEYGVPYLLRIPIPYVQYSV
jgi:hypothetical protein